MLRVAVALLAAAWLLLEARPIRAVQIVIDYGDAPGEGFRDGALGSSRMAALEFAAGLWAHTLAGEAPVSVYATMDALGGAGASAVLAVTAAVTLHRNFPGAPRRDVWYAAALANQLAAADLSGPDLPEIVVTFNSDVDGPAVLGSIGFYYGTDAQPGSDIDFVTIALHELGHGLNFFDTIDPASGNLVFTSPGIYDLFLEWLEVGSLAFMRRAERLAAITSGELVWNGRHATAFNGSAPRIYAPDPFQPGSSLSHWDVSFAPDELIEPFYTAANHDLGLLLPALVDMGWPLAVPTLTPRATPATPTPTGTARPTPSPTSRPGPSRDLAYVANFDDASVTVIDVASNTVTATLAVDDGPIGAAASADGRRVYIAGFHAARLSVIDTAANAVIDSIPSGGSAHGVALSPDGALAYVTDPFRDAVSVIDLVAGDMIDAIPVGRQPSGIAVDPNGLVFVANFGSGAVSVIDSRRNRLRAILALDDEPPGLLGIAVAPSGRFGYVTTFRFGSSGTMYKIDTRNLVAERFAPGEAQAVAIHPDATRAYATTHTAEPASGRVLLIDTDTNGVTTSIRVGDVPEALQITPDGTLLYVANTGSNTVSVIRTATNTVVDTVAVGAAPMGIAIARAPIAPPPSPTPAATATATVRPCVGDCDADGRVTIDDLVRGIDIALGTQPVAACRPLDRDASGTVTIDEVIAATRNALAGCS